MWCAAATQLFSRVIVAVVAGHHKKALFSLEDQYRHGAGGCSRI